MSEPTERQTKTNPNVVHVTLSPLTRLRLEALGRGEFFGGGTSAVARRFIEDGVRRAVDKGWLADSKIPPLADSTSASSPSEE